MLLREIRDFHRNFLGGFLNRKYKLNGNILHFTKTLDYVDKKITDKVHLFVVAIEALSLDKTSYKVHFTHQVTEIFDIGFVEILSL